MGMQFQLRPLTSDQLARLTTDPVWVNWVLGQTFPSATDRDRMLAVFDGAQSTMARRAADDFAAWPVGPPPAELRPALELDKAWHAIHFLLAGDPWACPGGPATRAVLGGSEIAAIDAGYGPMRVHAAAEVAAIATALRELRPDLVLARFDPAALAAADIYPMNQRWSLDDRDWIETAYAELRTAYLEAAEHGLGVALWIS